MKTNVHGEIQPHIRTMYNYDRDAISEETGTTFTEPTLAQQSFKDEVNVNTIMRKFVMSGELPNVIRPVMPEEFEEVFDFQSAMNKIRRAQEEFMKLPSGVRARFQNNPQVFTQFLQNPENQAEATKMGLIIPRPKKDPPASETDDSGGA